MFILTTYSAVLSAQPVMLSDVVSHSVTIFVEAKHLTALPQCEILRCAQDDNGYALNMTGWCAARSSALDPRTSDVLPSPHHPRHLSRRHPCLT